jgi:hypothetical protein
MPICLVCGQAFVAELHTARFCGAACEKEAFFQRRCFLLCLQRQALTVADFTAMLADRWLREIARTLIWEQRKQQFMVCEDYTLATLHSEAFTLTTEGRTIITPVWRCSAEWQRVLHDYEIIRAQPTEASSNTREFAQMNNAWLLTFAARSAKSNIQIGVAGNPRTTPATLDFLARHAAAYQVKVAVARHAATPPATLDYLARQTFVQPEVCHAIAQHGATPAETIAYLAQHANARIRLFLARRTHLPEHLMLALARDPSGVVRAQVAKNSTLSLTVSQVLVQDPAPSIRETLAKNAHLDGTIIERLCRDPQETVRVAVALHPALPLPLVIELAQDPAATVRAEAALCRKLPATLLAQLCHDPAQLVRVNVLRNQALPAALVRQLAFDDPDPLVREEAHHMARWRKMQLDK